MNKNRPLHSFYGVKTVMQCGDILDVVEVKPMVRGTRLKPRGPEKYLDNNLKVLANGMIIRADLPDGVSQETYRYLEDELSIVAKVQLVQVSS